MNLKARGKPRANFMLMNEQPIKRKRGRPRKHPLPEPKPEAVVISVVETVKRKRGRPRKNPLPTTPAVKPEVKKDYYVLAFEDIEMWAETTGKDMFKQAVNDYKKICKAKVSAEIRWHKDGITVVAV